MAFEQAFRFSSVLLAASAFTGLILAHAVPLWLALISGTILSLVLLQAAGIVPYPVTVHTTIPPTVWNMILIVAFLGFVVDLAAISRELLPAGIHFLVILLTVKLASLSERRDFRHLYAISLMAILASAALTTEVWYVPVFVLYLLTAVWTLLLYHLTDDVSRGNPSEHSLGPSNHINGRFFWFTNGIAFVAFGLTLLIFFLTPRISTGWVQKSPGSGLRTTGFSERVDLGTIGSIKQDPSIVMRVELPDQPSSTGKSFYLRGTAYNLYDGRAWNTSLSYRRALTLNNDGTFAVRSSGARPLGQAMSPVRQDILLESIETSVLFAAPVAESVTGEFPAVQIDTMGGLHLPFPSSTRIRYSVSSQARQMMPDELTAVTLDYPEGIRRHYLQVPDLSGQVARLARTVVGNITSPYAKAELILQHLSKNYQYSLDVETSSVENPLEDFLFVRKTGYCEHYATAMVILLRTLGIPARLVTGFLATEWNEFGGYYTVRQQDAHAWVEVYFPRSGWITMDPTPTVSTPVFVSRWDVLRQLSESFRLHWDRLFVRYSVGDQLAVVQGIRHGGDFMRDQIASFFSSMLTPLGRSVATLTSGSTQWLLPLIGLLFVLACLPVVMWHMKRESAAAGDSTSRQQQAIVRHYVQVIKLAERRGVTKPVSATSREFAQQISQEWAVATPTIASFANLYSRGRFSRQGLTSEELAEAAECVSLLRRIVRS